MAETIDGGLLSEVPDPRLGETLRTGPPSSPTNPPASLSPAPPAFLELSELLATSPASFGSRLQAVDPKGLLLVQAARSGDARSVEALVDVAGFHPDVYPETAITGSDEWQLEQRTPLSWAAGQGHKNAVTALLERGADPNRVDKRGMTALHWAATGGWAEIVGILLAWYRTGSGKAGGGVNGDNGKELEGTTRRRRRTVVDWMDSSGRTPLSRAAGGGHAEVVKLLLEEANEEDCLGFALLDTEDSQGRTALSWAAGNGHREVVQGFLDIVSERERAQTEEEWKTEGDPEIFQWRSTPLEVAKRLKKKKGREEVATIMAGLGLDLAHADYHGRTPLIWAAIQGHAAIVKLLLDYGDDSNTEDNRKRTPLWWAATEGHEDVVRTLLQERAADPEHESKEGTPISQAILHGHDGVIELLEGAINKSTGPLEDDRETLLWWAIKEGYAAVVESLLQSGVNPDIKYDGEQQPLLWAAAKGDEAIVYHLLTHGAKTEIAGSWYDDDHGIPGYNYGYSRTPLLWAAGNGHLGVVKLLLNKGAFIDAEDSSHETPLARAAGNGHAAVVDFLLQYGARLSKIPEKKKTYSYSYSSSNDDSWRAAPLQAAVKGNHLGIAKELMDRMLKMLPPAPEADTNLKGHDGRTLLSWAASLGHEDAVTQLLSRKEFKTAINDEDDDGRTPLSYASEGGYEAIVRLLLQNKASVESQARKNRTALWFAAANGHHACVRWLLDSKADPCNADSENGDTPLHLAATNGHLTVASLLLDHGVDVDIFNSSKLTPLSHAAEQGHLPIVNLLLSLNAEPEAEKSYAGESPLSRAAGNGHLAVVAALLAHGATVNPTSDSLHEPPLSRAAGGGHAAVVDLLLSPPHLADVNWRPPSKYGSGRPPLIAAAENGNERVVRRLIVCGAEIDMEERWYSQTALCKAADKGHEAVVRLLLEKGAAVEVPVWRNYPDKRPVVLAAKAGWTGIVRMLLDRGAGVQRDNSRKENRAGWKERWKWKSFVTPLKEAAEEGHEEVVRVLLEKMLELATEGIYAGEISKRNIGSKLDWTGWWGLWHKDGGESTIKTLLEFGMDPNFVATDGSTPLCKANNVAVTRLILEAGALPNLGRDRDGETALMIAVRSRLEGVVKLLLDYKADPEIKDNKSRAPLLLAAKSGNLNMVKLLVEGGANLETEDEQGRTPLSWAGWNRHKAVMEYLLKSHADPDGYLGQRPDRNRTRGGWYGRYRSSRDSDSNSESDSE